MWEGNSYEEEKITNIPVTASVLCHLLPFSLPLCLFETSRWTSHTGWCLRDDIPLREQNQTVQEKLIHLRKWAITIEAYYKHRQVFRAVRTDVNRCFVYPACFCHCLYGSGLIKQKKTPDHLRLLRLEAALVCLILSQRAGLDSKMAEYWHALILCSLRRQICFSMRDTYSVCPSLIVPNTNKLPRIS